MSSTTARRLWPALLFCLALLPARLSAAASETLAQIRTVNQRIDDLVKDPSGSSALDSALTDRAALIAELIREDPQSVRGAALDGDTLQRLGAQSGANRIEQSGEWTGSLEIIAEMDFKNHKNYTHYFMRSAKERIELFGGPRAFRGFESRGGASVHVRGIRASSLIAVDTIVAATTASSSTLALSSVGVETYAVLIVNSPANPALPSSWTNAAIQNIFFGASGLTLNTFWQEASYGKTSSTGSVFRPVQHSPGLHVQCRQ